jgi:predicted dehydrogenase
VIVCVNVGKHYELAKPALLGKKDVYVEWPLGATVADARELTDLAREKGVRTAVGLQARSDRLVLKLKELLATNEIGDVVSSTVAASMGLINSIRWTEASAYYLDMATGGNSYHIFLATVSSILHTRHRWFATNCRTSPGLLHQRAWPLRRLQHPRHSEDGEQNNCPV